MKISSRRFRLRPSSRVEPPGGYLQRSQHGQLPTTTNENILPEVPSTAQLTG
jgi:hypothetical protein